MCITQVPLFERVLQLHPYAFTFTVLCYLKYYNPLQQQVSVCFISVFVAVAARTHHRAHAPTLARRLTYTQTQARTHCPIELRTVRWLVIYWLTSIFAIFTRLDTWQTQTFIITPDSWCYFLLLLCCPLLLLHSWVAWGHTLTTSATTTTSKHALRTLLLSISWHALRCVALRTKAANRLKATNEKSRVSSSSGTDYAFDVCGDCAVQSKQI